MMNQRAIFIVSLLVLSTVHDAEAGKRVTLKSNKRCVVDSEPDKKITLGKQNRNDVSVCRKKCIEDDQCLGMEFIAPKTCNLFYSPIPKVNNSQRYGSFLAYHQHKLIVFILSRNEHVNRW